MQDYSTPILKRTPLSYLNSGNPGVNQMHLKFNLVEIGSLVRMKCRVPDTPQVTMTFYSNTFQAQLCTVAVDSF